MIGVTDGVSRAFSEDELLAAVDAHGSTLDLHGTYRREGNTVTLPLNSHLRWAAEGWTLVDLEAGAKATIVEHMANMPRSRVLVTHPDGETLIHATRVGS